ncbi:phage major tail tube protein [Cognatishimia sp. MH4019]|uniref:phage major tail tube protein n=1 Tax=Cognatishimia sp. MH4019 TaxID=2854030 RepID=UPI001CD73256|nr:phage major tail tube protein [Cognatishimia sp. MH4019]
MRDILKFMNTFVDGYGFAGVASAVEVPKIEVATRDFTAAGMSGPIEVRMARLANALTAKLTFEGFDPHLYETLDITEGSLIPFTCKGSTEDGDGTTHAHNVAMRGFLKVLDEGEWKDGESVPLKIDMSLRYYRRERDGVELFEIEPARMLFRVKGKDLLAEHRANVGR